MKDDYLWDRSGEPDPDIERLERVLGRLRHEPRPLDMPAALPRRPPFSYGLRAAAAAILLTILGGGMWLAVSRRPTDEDTNNPQLLVASTVLALPGRLRQATAPIPPVTVHAETGEQAARLNPSRAVRRDVSRRALEVRESAAIHSVTKRGRSNRADQETMKEGEMAKEQLMLALRYASSKLNLVQRKLQVNKARGPAS